MELEVGKTYVNMHGSHVHILKRFATTKSVQFFGLINTEPKNEKNKFRQPGIYLSNGKAATGMNSNIVSEYRKPVNAEAWATVCKETNTVVSVTMFDPSEVLDAKFFAKKVKVTEAK